MLNNDSVDTLPGNWMYLSIPPYTALRFTVSNLIAIMIKMHDHAYQAIILIHNILRIFKTSTMPLIPVALLSILTALYNLAKLVLSTVDSFQE